MNANIQVFNVQNCSHYKNLDSPVGKAPHYTPLRPRFKPRLTLIFVIIYIKLNFNVRMSHQVLNKLNVSISMILFI